MRILPFTVIPMILLATPAWAHAHLTSSEPAAGAATPPTDTVRLTFSEAIEAKFSKVTVKGDGGADQGPASLRLDPSDSKVVIATLPKALGAGSYQLHWQVVSVDTHRTEGDFAFAVK